MAKTAIERIYRLTADGSKAVRELEKISKATRGIDQEFQKLKKAAVLAAKATAAIGTAMTVFNRIKGITDVANQVTLLEASFAALTDSAERGTDLIGRAFSLIEETGAGFEDVSTSLQRLTIGMNELGATNAQIEGVAEAFIKIGRIGGTSMFSINQALVQFTQGLSSGRLQGDELRSILERVPLITSLIADEMGRTRGEIKELGKEGKITSDIMVNALLSALPNIRRDFELLPVISEQAMNRIGAQWIKLQTEFAVESGLASGFVSFLETVGDAIEAVRPTVSSLARGLSEIQFAFQLVGTGIEDNTTSWDRLAIKIALVAAVLAKFYLALKRSIASMGLLAKWALRITRLFNPITAAITIIVTVLGVFGDQIRVVFQSFLLRVSQAQVMWYNFLGALEEGGHAAGQVIAEILTLGAADTDSDGPFVSKYRADAEAATAYVRLFEEGYVKSLDRLDKKAKETQESVSRLGKPITTAEITAASQEFLKLAGSLDPTVKLNLEFAESMTVLAKAFDLKAIDTSEFEKYQEILLKNRRAALDAIDPMVQLQNEYIDLAASVDPSIQASNDFAASMTILARAFDAKIIDAEQFDRLQEALLKIKDGAAAATDPLEGLGDRFSELLNKVDPTIKINRDFADSMATLGLAFQQKWISEDVFLQIRQSLVKTRQAAIDAADPLNELRGEYANLARSLDPVIAANDEFAEKMTILALAWEAGMFKDAPEQFAAMRDMLMANREAAIAAADPMAKLREEFGNLHESLDPVIGIMADFDEKMSVLKRSLAEDDISLALFEELEAILIRNRDAALLAADPIEQARLAYIALATDLDPAIALQQQFTDKMTDLAFALQNKVIDPDLFGTLRDDLLEWYEAAKKAADPTTQLKGQFESLLQTIDPNRGILVAFAEQMNLVQKAINNPDIELTAEQIKYLTDNLIRMRDESLNGTGDGLKTMLEEIKDAVDGFVSDFTNKLVDSLSTGELKFKDFAKSVLETISKMMLNRLFTQFFNMLLGGNQPVAGGGSSGIPLPPVNGYTLMPAPVGAPAALSTAGLGGNGIARMMTSLSGISQQQPATVSVNVTNNAPVDVQVSETRKGTGELDIELLIEERVQSVLSNGGADKAMRTSFGITRRGF